jgi:hypothetical protein
MFNNSVPTAKKTKVSISKISWLMLFREIIAVYPENHTKPINTFCGQSAELLTINAVSTYTYHWAIKG